MGGSDEHAVTKSAMMPAISCGLRDLRDRASGANDTPMIVSALVVTLDSDLSLRTRALAALAEDERIEIGEPIGERVPVVAATETTACGAQLCEELAVQPGVVRVDVVSIEFSEAL